MERCRRAACNCPGASGEPALPKPTAAMRSPWRPTKRSSRGFCSLARRSSAHVLQHLVSAAAQNARAPPTFWCQARACTSARRARAPHVWASASRANGKGRASAVAGCVFNVCMGLSVHHLSSHSSADDSFGRLGFVLAVRFVGRVYQTQTPCEQRIKAL